MNFKQKLKTTMWRVGRGREPWERSEAGGVDDNERHLRHSPVSSPTEELRKIKGGATIVEDERGPGLDFNLCFVCGSLPWGAAALLLCLFMLLKLFKC